MLWAWNPSQPCDERLKQYVVSTLVEGMMPSGSYRSCFPNEVIIPSMGWFTDLEVSWNGGTPKSSIFIFGFSIINQPFGGSPIYGNPHFNNSLGTSTAEDLVLCPLHRLDQRNGPAVLRRIRKDKPEGWSYNPRDGRITIYRTIYRTIYKHVILPTDTVCCPDPQLTR